MTFDLSRDYSVKSSVWCEN